MATRIQLRRGNTSDHSTFTGAEGEVTVDTDKNTIVVHDGSQAGGYPLVNMDGSDIKMQVDGDGDTYSRIVFDSIQHPHSEDSDGFTNPVFIIQANYDSTANYGGQGVGTEYLDANISQIGNGDLNISAGKLRLRGKRYYDNDPTGDDKYAHDSDMGLSIDGDETQGTILRLHWGQTNNTNHNIRLQPSENGIIVEGMGGASSTTDTKSNTGTIGTFNDEDLLTLAQNQLTVAGTVTADGMAIYTSTGNISASTLVTERGKRIIINGDHDITLPDATASEVGYTWVIHNTHSGAITLDKGTADQTVKHLTGSAVTTITVATGTSVNIASGGVAELVCTAADNYIIFGSGIS